MITFYTGGMFAGKTTSLLLHANKRTKEGKRVILLKPSFDTRDGVGIIKTHDNIFKKAVSVQNLESILQSIEQFDVYCFDEIQFFDVEVIDIILKLKELNKEVVVAGLDLDFKREWFKTSLALYNIADVKETLLATCGICGESAGFSLRLTASKEIFQLGAEEKYIPVCIGCHKKFYI